jgi:hypothetical protein
MNFTKKKKLLSNFIKLVCEDKNNQKDSENEEAVIRI